MYIYKQIFNILHIYIHIYTHIYSLLATRKLLVATI